MAKHFMGGAGGGEQTGLAGGGGLHALRNSLGPGPATAPETTALAHVVVVDDDDDEKDLIAKIAVLKKMMAERKAKKAAASQQAGAAAGAARESSVSAEQVH